MSRDPVKSYSAEVVAINGSETGPFAPGPASSFHYDIDITMDERVVRKFNIAPHPMRRWDDTIDVNPFPIGCPVTVHRIGTVYILDTVETPDMRACTPGGLR